MTRVNASGRCWQAAELRCCFRCCLGLALYLRTTYMEVNIAVTGADSVAKVQRTAAQEMC